MLLIRIVVWLMDLSMVIGLPQFNLHYTDVVCESSSKIFMERNCLYARTRATTYNGGPHEILVFCLSECPSKWKIENNNHHQKLTFAGLRMQNITSQELYLWSAPMDLIEHYQFYLNQLSNSMETDMDKELFYNCTYPWFGPMCQYMFDQYESYHLSFAHMIDDFYRKGNEMNFLTCYTHLECNRGISSICLDWSDICNGIIDCIDGGQDEEHCWQLEVNDCEDNEYRCRNGECIPNDFYRDGDSWNPECLDGSDELFYYDRRHTCSKLVPAFLCEDITCTTPEFSGGTFQILSSSSCTMERGKLLMEAIFLAKQNSVNDTCWFSLMCASLDQNYNNPFCHDFCGNQPCYQIIEENCPHLIYLPSVPLLFGHVYFIYTNKIIEDIHGFLMPTYICYNDHLCNEMPTTMTLLSSNNDTCRHYNDLPYPLMDYIGDWDTIVYNAQILFKTCTSIINQYSPYCNMSTMYQCLNSSKCISIYRLNDGIRDCFYEDDENFVVNHNETPPKSLKNCYKCKESNKCINRRFINDDILHCPLGDDEYWTDFISTHVSFQTICDGFTEIFPQTIDGREETDETECEQWPCNNMYTRCDTIWNCLNGADELNCSILPISNCTSIEHMCVSPVSNQFMCLPIEKANDGIVDCLGGTDERQKCRDMEYSTRVYTFYCANNGIKPCLFNNAVCDGYDDCMYGEDEQFCETSDHNLLCRDYNLPFLSDKKMFFCTHLTDDLKRGQVFFSLDRIDNSINQRDISRLSSPIARTTFENNHYCHRGIDMRVWLGKETNSTIITCLCPSNYYGNMCQYQNQRVSLTMQIHAPSNAWSIPFAFIISLIDNDDRMINSYYQLTYLSARDCQTKFNIYLFYSTRPNNQTKNYSIHIDAYEKIKLTYRSSWIIPIKFPFLPVQRTIARLMIPHRNDDNHICPQHQCVNGQCIKYTNKNKTFCRCNQGWIGRYCNISYRGTCSIKSLCVGVSNENRSICICPLGKFGDRCLIENPVCQSNSCQNGGQCVPIDETIAPYNFSCICPKGFSGDKCEIIDTKIIVSFKKIILSQSIFVHFIKVLNNSLPARVTTFKTIGIDQDSTTIWWSHPFNIMFIEPSNNIYYLVILQKTYVPSTTLIRTINPSHRCLHIRELFNDTLFKSHLLRRIKSYHIPCQNRSAQLSCFYDDIHICLCNDFEKQRLSNCFEFDHNMKHDCIGKSVCENGGQCFQDDSKCPQSSICMCNECFYGTRCQFTTQGFGLSLDAILGYHIRPNITLKYQPLVIKVSAAVSILMPILGILNGILSIITFKRKKLREVGCGLYLLSLSINCILTMIIFMVKFWLLVLLQMGSIRNRLFINIQCHSIDFVVQICLSMDQWLNSCVAIERVITTIKGAKYDKKMSKRRAKWIIFIIFILIILSVIHDPIHRRLIDDNEQRIWCIVNYSTKLNIFNSVINIIHFLLPFIINIISAVLIMIIVARQRSVSNARQTFREHLQKQFREHKHLIISPCVLILLAFPRLYISFISGCMKSARDPWLYLISYFISFSPSMITFIVFVVPSQLYRKEFYKIITQYRNTIRQRLYINN